MKSPKRHNPYPYAIGTTLLILLWSYTGLSKILGYAAFERQTALIFPAILIKPVAIGIPALEIMAAMALAFRRTITFGLYLSLMLITAFTLYVILVVTSYFPAAPCSCGGIVSALSWKQHLILNTMFLCLVIYLLFTQKIRKEAAVTT